MRYLLDTNIVSDLVRHPQGKVVQRIRKVGETPVCTSIIVSAELRYGAAKRGSTRLSTQLEAVLSALDILPLGPRQTPSMHLCAWVSRERARPSAPTTC